MAAVGIMAYPGRETYNGYPQQYAMYPARALQTQAEVAINANPYGTYTSPSQPQHQQQPQQQQQQHTQQQQHVTRSPQPSGSPVSDDGFKPSLPSISNLLGIADRPTHDLASQHAQTSTQLLEQAQQRQSSPQQYHAEARARVSYHAQDQSTSPRTVVHPSAPLRTDSVLEGTQSPSAISNASMSGPPYFVGSAINNVEPADQRTTQVQMMKRNSVPSQPNLSPYGGSARYTSSPYANSPGAGSTTSYFSPTEANYPVPHNLYQQRPLPSNFPPQPMAVQQTSHMPTSNPWEHHHYISPSSQATFPQSQDRYICPTCNKAFSRPSSLKIHINSHTGEKPFKCPQPGCGKAFSVRSNMKRHHRGCHTTGVANHMPSHQHSHLMV